MKKSQLPILDRDELVCSSSEKIDKIRGLRPLARRFYLDDEASSSLGHILRETEREVVLNRQFALPPYERCYVEFSLRKTLEALGRPESADDPGEADNRIGFLYDRGHLTVLVSSDSGRVGVSPVEYRLDLPGVAVFENKKSVAEETAHRAALILGTTFHALSQSEATDAVNSLRIVFMNKKAQNFVWACAGEARIFWLIMLLLNCPKDKVSVQEVPRSSGLVGGSRKIYAAHGVVRIHLSAQKGAARRLVFGDRAPPRRHDVMAHFVHYHLAPGCEHRWPALAEVSDEGVLRWRCESCGGLRVRRRECVRGDAGVGFRTKTYEVTG